MLHATKPKIKQKHVIRFPGICADAKQLGVNRVTLNRALRGVWRLPGLVARYEKLKRRAA